MAADSSIRACLLSRLAHRPRVVMTRMIKISKPATSSTITRSPDPANVLGRLDKLPLELLHFTFSMLDLKTLSNISQTCLRGLAVIESLPEFRNLIRHAPSTMTALGSTQLIGYHSAYVIHSALTSSNCVSCGEFGTFLFLPTCERCCYGCLWSNQSLWVIPIALASSCFKLPPAIVEHLPIMRSLSDHHLVFDGMSFKRQVRLVSVKAAKRLALEEGETVESLAQRLESRGFHQDFRNSYEMFQFWQGAPLEPPGASLAEKRLGALYPPNDRFYGLTTIPFPSLTESSRLECGLHCLGCYNVFHDDGYPRQYEVSARLSARGYAPSVALGRIAQIARSEADFFEHVSHCEGAKELVSDLEEKLKQMEQP